MNVFLLTSFFAINMLLNAGGPATGGAAPSPITVDTNWGTATCSSASICTATSLNRTLTVPAGNSGTVKLTGSGDGTMQYSTNAGSSWTTFTTGQTYVATNGSTLELRTTGIPAATEQDITVVDNDTGSTIGTAVLQNTHA